MNKITIGRIAVFIVIVGSVIFSCLAGFEYDSFSIIIKKIFESKVNLLPARYCFGIFALVYVLLTVYALWQLLTDYQSSCFASRIVIALIFSFLNFDLWTLVWMTDYQQFSLIPAFVMLANLLWVMSLFKEQSGDEKLFYKFSRFTFSVFTGFSAAMVIINLNVVIYLLTEPVGKIFLTLQLLATLGLINVSSFWAAYSYKNTIIPWVFNWFLFGLAVRFMFVTESFIETNFTLFSLLVNFLIIILSRKKKRPQTLLEQQIHDHTATIDRDNFF